MNISDLTDAEVRDLDPESLRTRAECLAAMDRIDMIKADIQGQLNAARAKFEADGEKSDPHWLYSAKSALHYCKVQRAAFQARMTIIRQQERAETIRQATATNDADNVRFIKAAKAMLPEETYLAIWATVNKVAS